ncbi:MAG: hypothetical protein ACYTFM_02685 [Planctomycetota bacterium]
MNTKYLYRIECLAVGFLVLILLSVSLFWVRFLCEAGLITKAEEHNHVGISPSGLLPMDIENDPNVDEVSRIYAGMHTDFDRPFEWLGWQNFLQSRMTENHWEPIYPEKGSIRTSDMIYFDKISGHIVLDGFVKLKLPDEKEGYKRINLHVGPEGVSEDADSEIGRFYDPVLEEQKYKKYEYQLGPVLYDKKLRRFFRINRIKRTIRSGPELEKTGIYNPVQIGYLNKNAYILGLSFIPPSKEVVTEIPSEEIGEVEESIFNESLIKTARLKWGAGYTLVLDKSGRIDLLDIEKLELAGTAGWLPYFRSKQKAGPDELLGYLAEPVTLRMDEPYRGLITASINREGMVMKAAVYDSQGKLKLTSQGGSILGSRDDKYDWKYRIHRKNTRNKVYFGSAWAPTLTIMKYLGENLHPPVLSMLSYFTADSFEAESGYRAMFVMPNSFAAMKGRQVNKGEISKLFDAILFFMGPGIILSVLLAWRIGRDAKIVGISEEERMWWITATVLFGLVGYITYRVVRYKESLVTCVNCGKMRRFDMEFCHRCGAGWEVPELAQPQWRVIS